MNEKDSNETNDNHNETYEHWITTSDNDYKTMKNLFKSKDFHWSLFIGHLVLERLLKAYISKLTRSHAPFTHDLRRLSKKQV